jgi:hypothetical protein
MLEDIAGTASSSGAQLARSDEVEDESERRQTMPSQDDEFNWRQSLERLGSAALDLVTGLAGRAAGEQGPLESGTVVTETREVSGFTQVRLSGFGSLNVTQTGAESLTISADDDILPHLTAEVINGTLELGVKPRLSFKSMKRIVYTVTVKSLEGIQLAGAGTIHAADIRASSLSVAISGAGDMTISGGAHAQSVKISGAGNYNAREFQTDIAEVVITGAGNARVSASQSVSATVSGAGAVTYYGTPQVSQRITGIGSVKQG